MTKDGLRRHSLIYVGSAAVNALVPFMVLPLLTRWLGPQGFGVVGTFMAAVNVTAILAGLSAHGKISVSYFKEGAQAMPAAVGAALALLGCTALPLLLLMLLCGPWLSRFIGVPPEWLWAVWVCASGQFVVMVTLAVWQARGEAMRYGMTQIANTIGWASCSAFLIGVVGMGWQGRALGQAVSAVVMTSVLLVLLSWSGLVAWRPDAAALRGALRFGAPLLPHSLAAAAMSTIDRFALSHSEGKAATGEYFAAFQIAALLTVGAGAINQAWTPWLYARLARNTDLARHEIVRTTRILCLALLLAGVAIACAAPFIVHVVAGDRFASASSLLVFLAPGAAFGGMYYFVTGYLFYSGRTGVLSTVTVTAACCQVALTFMLVNSFGASGVAVASMLSSMLYFALTAIAANWVMPMPWLTFRRAVHEGSKV